MDNNWIFFENERYFIVLEKFRFRGKYDSSYSLLYVSSTGFFPNALTHSCLRPNGASTWQLIYCIAGKGFVSLNNSDPLPVGKGQLIFLPPNIPHHYYASNDEPWSVYWIHFNGVLATNLLKQPKLQGAFHLLSPGYEIIEQLFEECFYVLKRKYSFTDYVYLCQIVSHMLGSVSYFASEAGVKGKGEIAVNTAIAYMKEKLYETLTLEELISHTRYSSSYLLQLFKKITQSSPMNYYRHMKIQAASKDIFFTQLPINEIAAKYGFTDPLYFSRLFKKTMSMSPTEYRNRKAL